MRRIFVVFGILAIAVGMVYLLKAVTTVRANARTHNLNVDVENLFVGLQQYKEHIGSYPAGENADIVKAMLGKNPKNVIILFGPKNALNSKGELVDPWGTPLRIYFAGEGILIRSAGPNKRFDDNTNPEYDDFIRAN